MANVFDFVRRTVSNGSGIKQTLFVRERVNTRIYSKPILDPLEVKQSFNFTKKYQEIVNAAP